jgi:hypothetical protein
VKLRIIRWREVTPSRFGKRMIMIKKVAGGYKVLSEDGKKNLGRPYKTKKEAEKRLRQVEYFKRNK